jgi:hypothetical protein
VTFGFEAARFGAFAAFALAAGGALADACVGAADMDRGVRATFVDGGHTDYRRDSADTLRITEAGEDGSDRVYLSRHGIYDITSSLTAGGEETEGSRIDIAYSGDSLPPPAAGTTWTGQITLRYGDGTTQRANAAYAFGRAGSLSLAGCTYKTLPVKAAFLTANSWIWQEFIYVTDLGLGVIVASQTDAEAQSERGGITGFAALP